VTTSRAATPALLCPSAISPTNLGPMH
jgi:hypothetical protein